MDALTSTEYLEMMAKISQPGKSKQKYKNKWIVVDGVKFHSIKEASYNGELRIRKMGGEFKDFQRQVRYKLIVNDVLICTYVADFVIEYFGGGIQVIDVKSEFTRKLPEYRKKKKLMLALYGIEIKEV